MKAFEGWYCAHCQRGVDASEVTFHEQHTVCGRTITDDTPPEPPVKESLTTERPEDGPAGWRPAATHRPRYGQRVFLRRNGIVQIGSPTFDGGDDGDFWDFDTFGIDSAEVDWESDEWMPIDDLGDCLDAVKAERDALRAENAELRERVKELEADAARYQWLREECKNPSGGLTIAMVTGWGLEGWSGDDPDSRIDAAMREKGNDYKEA